MHMEHQQIRYAEPRRGACQAVGLADGSTLRLYPRHDEDLVQAGQTLELWSLDPGSDCLFVVGEHRRIVAAGLVELLHAAREWRELAEELRRGPASGGWLRRLFRRGRSTPDASA